MRVRQCCRWNTNLGTMGLVFARFRSGTLVSQHMGSYQCPKIRLKTWCQPTGTSWRREQKTDRSQTISHDMLKHTRALREYYPSRKCCLYLTRSRSDSAGVIRPTLYWHSASREGPTVELHHIAQYLTSSNRRFAVPRDKLKVFYTPKKWRSLCPVSLQPPQTLVTVNKQQNANYTP